MSVRLQQLFTIFIHLLMTYCFVFNMSKHFKCSYNFICSTKSLLINFCFRCKDVSSFWYFPMDTLLTSEKCKHLRFHYYHNTQIPSNYTNEFIQCGIQHLIAVYWTLAIVKQFAHSHLLCTFAWNPQWLPPTACKPPTCSHREWNVQEISFTQCDES